MTLTDNLTRQLKGDEGSKATVYKDSLGFYTIGVGRLVDPNKPGSGLKQIEIDYLLANDINDRINTLNAKLPWSVHLSEPRRAVLLNMSFQMGVAGLLGFTNTLKMIREGNFDGAATGMLQSKWAMQTPERAQRLSEQMRTDKWHYTPGT